MNGSQCSQPYLCIAHIPITGTKTRHHAMSPNPYGLFNTAPQNLANCNIIQKEIRGKETFQRGKQPPLKRMESIQLG
jgi:hypothetical protein